MRSLDSQWFVRCLLTKIGYWKMECFNVNWLDVRWASHHTFVLSNFSFMLTGF
jgi:hypothetical protein